jgi:predicted nuclease of predicted toxin-antitoxin system
VKLLFDEMLAPSLVNRLADLFQDSVHVRNLGLKQAPDTDVWHQAKNLGYAIVTKDKDFANLNLVWGAPPKVIFLQLGNCSVQQNRRPSSPGCGSDFGVREQLTQRSTHHHAVRHVSLGDEKLRGGSQPEPASHFVQGDIVARFRTGQIQLGRSLGVDDLLLTQFREKRNGHLHLTVRKCIHEQLKAAAIGGHVSIITSRATSRPRPEHR